VDYFAYGSNMDVERLRDRCPSAVVRGTGSLAGYRLVFNICSSGWNCGAANVVPDPSSVVWGVVASVSDEDLRVLDRFEGHPDHYQRVSLPVMIGSAVSPMWTYVAPAEHAVVLPSAAYMAVLIAAAIRHQCPAQYVTMLRAVPTRVAAGN
jgi:gamma-glutamylcyclotransferase (GGCT)/AIG2-like uncharacterized protein YtfP